MKAVALEQYLPIDETSSFLDVDLPKPEPKGRDILIAVEAIAVNPVDTKIRAGRGKEGVVEDPPRVIGWDASGHVEAVGDEVTLFKPGDEVWYAGDITRAGCNSEFQLVDERIVGRKPESLSHAEAAALPLTTITAYEAFFDRLGIDRDGADKGQSILIIGAGGGVGSIGIQLAKHAGLVVIATASRSETAAWVKELGADHVVNHREDMVAQVRALGMQHVDRFQGAHHHLEVLDFPLFVETDDVHAVHRNTVDFADKLQNCMAIRHHLLHVMKAVIQHVHGARQVEPGELPPLLGSVHYRGMKNTIISQDFVQQGGIALFDYLVPAGKGIHAALLQ